MKRRFKFWLLVVALLLLELAFVVELVRFIRVEQTAEERTLTRIDAIYLVKELEHCQRSHLNNWSAVSKSAAGAVLPPCAQSDHQGGLGPCNEIICTCFLRSGPARIQRYRQLVDGSVYRNHAPVEYELLRQLIETHRSAMAVFREGFGQQAPLQASDEGHPQTDHSVIEGISRRADMLTRVFEHIIIRPYHEEDIMEAARHHQWLIRLGLLQVFALGGGLWIARCSTNSLEHRAYHDELTSLPNRAYLELYLDLECARAEMRGDAVILAFIDLNGFKKINDTLGHHRGDEVLQIMSQTLKDHSRPGDLVARYGGDEFVVVMVVPVYQVRQSMQRLRKLLEEAFEYPCQIGEGLGFGAAVGVSVFPSRASGPRSLIATADEAMYIAKAMEESLAIVEYEGISRVPT